VSPQSDRAPRVLIVGATSAIAADAARAFAAYGSRLFLTGRNPERLAAVADDLRVRGAAQVDAMQLDVLETARHEEVVEGAAQCWGGLDVALVAHGVLPNQATCQADVQETLRAIEVNFTATVALLTILANRFELQGHGCLAVITSVAGDRGRRSNYVYGATKGGLHIFLQGLRSRLQRAGVSVIEIKPGLVDTPMTAHLSKHGLFASSRWVGRGVFNSIVRRRDIVYVPWFWRPIMLGVKLVPERLFKRLQL
jgi:NADP-dependent 3-hydroxy acid dehydrogenase YdfG